MLNVNDVVILQKPYGEFAAGTEVVVMTAKLKSETIEVERAGVLLTVKRVDVIRHATYSDERPSLAPALKGQRIGDFRNKGLLQEEESQRALHARQIRLHRQYPFYDRNGRPTT